MLARGYFLLAYGGESETAWKTRRLEDSKPRRADRKESSQLDRSSLYKTSNVKD